MTPALYPAGTIAINSCSQTAADIRPRMVFGNATAKLSGTTPERADMLGIAERWFMYMGPVTTMFRRSWLAVGLCGLREVIARGLAGGDTGIPAWDAADDGSTQTRNSVASCCLTAKTPLSSEGCHASGRVTLLTDT